MPTPDEQRLQNLQAVAEHLASEPAAARPAPAERSSFSRGLRRWGPLGVVLAFVLGKGKLLLSVVKLLKLQTLLTMFLAIWVYAQLWGAPFAVGFVLLILVHELGHAVVLRQQGIPAGAPVFIPFVGAVIAMKGVPRDAYVEALVALGGPVLGSAAALVCFGVGLATGEPIWLALASTGFLINLLNLLPISPLDGGRIVGVISRWIWVFGYAGGIALFLATYSPLLFLILLFGLFSLGRTLRGPREGYFEVEPAKRAAIGVSYFLLAGALAWGMWAADQRLAPLIGTHGSGERVALTSEPPPGP